ncbi:hypothetical protein DFP72DRAFT_1177813, partial [Ephemerocybe angulata]
LPSCQVSARRQSAHSIFVRHAKGRRGSPCSAVSFRHKSRYVLHSFFVDFSSSSTSPRPCSPARQTHLRSTGFSKISPPAPPFASAQDACRYSSLCLRRSRYLQEARRPTRTKPTSQASRVNSARGNSIHFTNDFDEHVQKELARPEYTVVVTLPRRRLQYTRPTQGGEDSRGPAAALSLAGIRSVAVRQTNAVHPYDPDITLTGFVSVAFSPSVGALIYFERSEINRIHAAGGGRQLSWPSGLVAETISWASPCWTAHTRPI